MSTQPDRRQPNDPVRNVVSAWQRVFQLQCAEVSRLRRDNQRLLQALLAAHDYMAAKHTSAEAEALRRLEELTEKAATAEAIEITESLQ